MFKILTFKSFLFSLVFIFPYFRCLESEILYPPEVKINIGAHGKPVVLVNESSYLFVGVFDEIQLECKSNYPNKWTFSSNPDGSLIMFFVNKVRNVLNINDNTTYIFMSELTLRFKNPTIHLNVSCVHVTREVEKEQNINTAVTLGTTSTKLMVKVEKSKGITQAGGPYARLGLNKDCKLILHFDKITHKYGCSSLDRNYVPVARLVVCNNNDECSAIIRTDSMCNTSVARTCQMPSCQQMPKQKQGAIICETGHLSVARAVFLTAVHPQTYYMKREEVNASNIMQVKILPNGSLFEFEQVTISCAGTVSYFSRGFIWAIQYKGDQIEYLERKSSYLETYSKDDETFVSEIRIAPNTSMIGVICYAPLWNSYKWESLTVTITINVIPPPNLVKEEENETRIVTEQKLIILECILKDTKVPRVSFQWFENGNILKSQDNRRLLKLSTYTIRYDNFSTKLTIFASMNTTYTCEATNIKGEKRKRYFIVWTQNTISAANASVFSSTLIKILIISSSIVFALIILIFILYRKNRSQSIKLQNLSEYDISEFVNGDPYSDNALFFPYNVQYEISRKDFHIESKVLGSGQFGVVLKGRLGKAPIAIKAIKKGAADVMYVKALLSELKIMSFVGRNDNIVCLIGACTENISKCEVYIICEFCANGSLLKYVKDSRDFFVDHNNPHQKYGSFRNSTTEYQNSFPARLTSKDLVRWAHEIASGMEFLSSKNVVHGDLAARNILLTEDLTAKVGDFGLSKQLFQYSVYVQRQECPLPLKWMAIESLQDLEFSVESDVWGYGVTLWEIFTLGQTPYPGVNWDFESWKLLRDGHRMEKPQFASENTYKVMLQCWEIDLNKRPTFTWLKNFFLDPSRAFVTPKRSRKGLIK